MSEQLNKADFHEEMSDYVEDIVIGNYRGVTVSAVMKRLFEESSGDTSICDEDLIAEIIDDLGGEPIDEDSDEGDYDEDERGY